MCDFFWQSRTEEKSGEGDLTDILLAGGLNLDNPSHTGHHEVSTPDWPCQHLSSNGPSTLQSLSLPSTDFGDPFMNIYDPLSDERSSLDFIDSNNCTANRANDLFSRMLHVSPPVMGTAEGIAGFGIASQRNLGLKRRKTQAKKVVCIPAPASTNARQGGGEVVPSDLWAWRKYGQKPIKGSPYPRGYYRCSSSKGCSARKQVERSRTDPNMLVITYTSEHNHPWPTQRNALAGSTRSQFSKHNNYSNPKSSFQQNNRSRQKITEETNETKTSHTDSNISTGVKEEAIGEINKAFELPRHDDLHKIMQQSRVDDAKTVPNSNFNSNDEFFEDLGEFFPLGKIMESIISDNNKGSNNRDIDPFKLLDWEP